MIRVRDALVAVAATLSLLIPFYFAAAALGTRFGLWDWRFGFGALTLNWGPKILMIALALGGLALAVALLVKPRRGRALALAALLIPALALGYAAYVRAQAAAIPAMHDISTDLADPPGFSQAVAQARAAIPGANTLDLAAKRGRDGTSYADMQRRAYPDIQPIALSREPAAAFAAAKSAAERLGWRITREEPEAGLLEAQARTFWFGFTDDIAIRIRATETGSAADVRSVSRVGVSDLGANARRIRAFRDLLLKT